MKKLIWYGGAFLGGAAYALGAPSWPIFHHPVIAIIGMSIFLASLSLWAPSLRHPLRHDLIVWALFSLGLYSVGFNWIPGTMQNFGGLNPALSYFLGLLAAFLLAPQILVFILLFHLGRKWGWPPAHENILQKSFSLLLLAIIWLLLENFIPQQFPYHLGHSFMRLAPYLAPATIGGEPLYSGAAIWLAWAIALFLRQRHFDFWPWAANLILITLSLLNPLPNPYLDPTAGTPLRLRLVQGSIGNDLKNRSERGDGQAIQEVNRIYHELSTSAASSKLDLIIWPETAIHQPFNTHLLTESPLINLPLIVDRTINDTHTSLFTGAYDIYDFQQFNSALYFSSLPPGHKTKFAGHYHKIKLLAFGETLPFGPLNSYLYKFVGDLVSNFTPGDEYPIFDLAGKASFIPNICYEILLTAWQRRYLQHLAKSPDLIINLTNDSWFGRTAEPEQHLFLGKWRAVEFQKAIVRSTNSGISTIIYPNGKTSARLEVDLRGNLDQTIYLHPTQPTIYQRWGLGVVLGISAILLLLMQLKAIFRKTNWPIKTKFKF